MIVVPERGCPLPSCVTLWASPRETIGSENSPGAWVRAGVDHKVQYEVMGSILYLDGGGGYTALPAFAQTQIYTLKRVNLLYVN